MKAGIIQFISSMDIHDNLQRIKPYIVKAKGLGAVLVTLPENFALMAHSEYPLTQIAETFGAGLIQETLSRLAREYEIWIVAGTLPLKAEKKRVRAACLVFNEQGLCVARYDKIHLFDVCIAEQETYQESNKIEPGRDIVLVDTPIGCLGLSVCYDLRFAELYRQLVIEGAQIFSIPSAFTQTTGQAHWEVLLKARAIENLCYVLAPNQGGQHENGRKTYGHSMVVEPWGGILACQPHGEGVSVVEIDLVRQKELRRRFPCNDHHVL